MLPNFIHAGVPKAASKTIQMILANHSEIYLPKQKEPSFFMMNALYEKGVEWYEETFYKDTGNAKIVCDLSIGYSSGLAIDTPERIRKTLGREIKILFILRDPVERAYSNYCMAKYKGCIEDLEFREAITRAIKINGKYDNLDLARVQGGSYYNNKLDMDIYRSAVYLDTGKYSETIKKYYKQFDNNRILIIQLKDLISNPQNEANKLYDFLNIERQEVDFSRSYNESTKLRFPVIKRTANILYRNRLIRYIINKRIKIGTKGKIKKLLFSWNYERNEQPVLDEETRSILERFYKNYNLELEELINRNEKNRLE